MKKYVCTICGYIYDEAAGSPDQGIAADTKWEDLPETWVCPICTAPKSMFNEVKEEVKEEAEEKEQKLENKLNLSSLEMSILCSNLAKGCEKQVLMDEMALFQKLADYFKAHAKKTVDRSF